MNYAQIPRDVIQTNKYVTFTANVMFLNNLLFLVTYGREIGLIMVEIMPTRMSTQLACNPKESFIYMLEIVFLYK